MCTFRSAFCLVLLLVGFSIDAFAQVAGEAPRADFPRPQLQVINGGGEPLEVFWINDEGKRVSNGRVLPGKDTIITTKSHGKIIIFG